MPRCGQTWWMMAAVLLFPLGYCSVAYGDCDEYNPAAPVLSSTIVLRISDAFDEQRKELRTFIETGSLGSVRAELISFGKKTSIQSFFATPVISRYSENYGEQLKGIAVGVVLEPAKRPASVSIRLHQVCATHFRNSFLSY